MWIALRIPVALGDVARLRRNSRDETRQSLVGEGVRREFLLDRYVLEAHVFRQAVLARRWRIFAANEGFEIATRGGRYAVAVTSDKGFGQDFLVIGHLAQGRRSIFQRYGASEVRTITGITAFLPARAYSTPALPTA